MTNKHHHPLFPLAAAVIAGLLVGCAFNQAKPMTAPSTLVQNDYPTLARVEFVVQCMQKKGAQNYDTLYSCVCSADKLAEKMNYTDYAEAQTFTNLDSLAGDRGNALRDAPQSRQLKKSLQEALGYAQDACTVARPTAQN